MERSGKIFSLSPPKPPNLPPPKVGRSSGWHTIWKGGAALGVHAASSVRRSGAGPTFTYTSYPPLELPLHSPADKLDLQDNSTHVPDGEKDEGSAQHQGEHVAEGGKREGHGGRRASWNWRACTDPTREAKRLRRDSWWDELRSSPLKGSPAETLFRKHPPAMEKRPLLDRR